MYIRAISRTRKVAKDENASRVCMGTVELKQRDSLVSGEETLVGDFNAGFNDSPHAAVQLY